MKNQEYLPNIIIDDKIPFIRGVLEPYAKVIYHEGIHINSNMVKKADALIVRTRTYCNRELLEGSNVKCIASATIGFDHIDVEYCENKGIEWYNAPGCNAISVTQYLSSTLIYVLQKLNVRPEELVLGIVGAGNVGSRVAFAAEKLGFNVLINDPPRERKEGSGGFVTMDEIRQKADIISLHVPLNKSGKDKTFYLVDDSFIDSCAKNPVIINTSRGEVINTAALKKALSRNSIKGAVLDVWENEPNPDKDLLESVWIATPHIAGYSQDGKANGTATVVREIARYFNLPISDWYPEQIPLPSYKDLKADFQNAYLDDPFLQLVYACYPVERESRQLKMYPAQFEGMRANYSPRREYEAYNLQELERLLPFLKDWDMSRKWQEFVNAIK